MMYHLLVDPNENFIKPLKRDYENKEPAEYWFDRIVKFNPDSITLWDGPILLNYYVGKEQNNEKV